MRPLTVTLLLAAAAATAFGILLAGPSLPPASREPAPPAFEGRGPAPRDRLPPAGSSEEDRPAPPPRTPWPQPVVFEEAGAEPAAVFVREARFPATSREVPAARAELERAWRRIRGDYGSERDLWAGNGGRYGFGRLTAIFPESALADSFAEYARIRGGTYFNYEFSDVTSDAKYHPDAEIPGFTAWVERYPGHPGQDDASFRLGRCFGLIGNGLEAVRWFRRAQMAPDGDMAADARAWETLWLDLLLPDEDLRALAGSGDPVGAYSFGVRLLRRGDYRAARATLRAVAANLDGWLRNCALGQAQAAAELADLAGAVAAAGPGDRDRALYNLGRRKYHDPDLYANMLWATTDWGSRSATLIVRGGSELLGNAGAPDAVREEAERGDARLRAREDFLRLVRECPDSPLVGKARYSAATALAWTIGGTAEREALRCPRELRIQVAREFLGVARDHPGESFADDALYHAGIFSGDRSCFETVVGRYPAGDMADQADAALRQRPESRSDLAAVPALIHSMRAGERRHRPWNARWAARRLEDTLGFCVGRILSRPDEAADRAVEELGAWFERARGWLEFDPAVGAWLIP